MIDLEELASFELFCELQKEELHMVANHLVPSSTLQELKPKEAIIQPGSCCTHIIFVLRGVIKTVQYTQDGKELVGNIFTRGSMFGCIEAVTGHLFNSYVKAVQNTSLLLFPVQSFKTLMQTYLPFKDAVIHDMAARSEDFVAHSFILKQKKARNRIALHLLHHTSHCRTHSLDYRFLFNIELLARYLNLTRSVLSRELHAMQEEGLLILGKNIISIRNREALLAEQKK